MLTYRVSESGSGNGAKSLINGVCDIADMSRFMKEKEFKAAVANGIMPVAHVAAVDGIAIVVHPCNRVKNLTVEQIRQDLYRRDHKLVGSRRRQHEDRESRPRY